MKIKKQKNKKKGFTLIELIIVIAILAILAALAIPKFGEVRKNANIKADISNSKTVFNAITTLIAQDEIDLPAAAGTKNFTFAGGAVSGGAAGEATALQNYLQSVPANKHNNPVPKNTGFFAEIDDDGNVKIYVGAAATAANEVYPVAPATSDYHVD